MVCLGSVWLQRDTQMGTDRDRVHTGVHMCAHAIACDCTGVHVIAQAQGEVLEYANACMYLHGCACDCMCLQWCACDCMCVLACAGDSVCREGAEEVGRAGR